MSRIFVGVDIHSSGLFLAALQRSRSATNLVGLRFESLEGALELSSQKPNVKDGRRFVEGLRRGLDALVGQEERIALSLPDRCGRIYLTEVDAPFKSKAEGVDILKWKLKSNLPASPAQVHLDYQALEKREDGRQLCVVAAISHPVLEQYEDLVNEAGRHALQIDFHSMNLYNYYRPRLDLGDEFILVSFERGLISIQYVFGSSLRYQRVREFNPDPQRAFQEINRTLIAAYSEYPAMKRCAIFAHVDPGIAEDVDKLLEAAFEREVKCVDPSLRKFAGAGKTGGLEPVGTVVAALGAAEQMMRR